jgi:TPR repeat protein
MNHCLPLVLIAMLGFSFSACTGGTEMPTNNTKTSITAKKAITTTRTQPVVNKQPPDRIVNESLIPEKYRLLLKKAKQGNVKAQFALGMMFNDYSGTFVKQNFGEALTWFKKAADHGHVEAQYRVALYYLMGDKIGLTKDEYQAYQYFNKAALKGHAESQFFLGTFYTGGKGGVKENEPLGYAWIDQAAKRGDPDAIDFKNSMLACPIFRRNSLAKGEALSVAIGQRIAKQQHG